MRNLASSNKANMSFRVNKNLKEESDKLFKDLKVNTSSIMVSYNEKLDEALDEINKIKNGEIKAKEYDKFEDVLKDI